MLRALCPLFLASVVVCQDAAERCAAALLRGDAEAAAEAATSAADPAERARLLAALSPPSHRPAAMLAVAARFADSAQADLAILAGAAAVLALRDRGRAVPELQTWYEVEDAADDDDLQVPAPVIEGLWRQLDQRRAAGGDLAVLAEAEQLLLRCSVSRFGFEPVRVVPTATWSLPERREELLLRAWRRQPGRSGWHELAGRGPADREVSLPIADPAPIAGLPAGDWLVELASTTTRWRGLRAVEVSDLDVVALFDGTHIALGAWRGDQAVAGGDWWIGREPGAGPQRGAFAATTAVFGSGPTFTDEELFVQAEGQRARVPLGPVWQPPPGEDTWQVHLMVDRPIYRPGETVHGRLVLRETSYDGEGVDAIAHSRVVADRDLELRVLSGAEQIRLRGRSDDHGVFEFEVPLPDLLAPGAVPFELVEAGHHEVRLYHDRPCEIAEFRRASLLVDVVGAESVARGEDATAAVRAAWASGAPAAGLRVWAEVRAWTANGALPTEQHELTTDASGLATLELPLRAAAATWVRVTFVVATPDGPKTLTHSLAVRDPGDVDEGRSWWRRDRSPSLFAPEVATVGVPCAVTVRGAAGSRVLFVAGRGRGTRAQSVLLDADGQAVVQVMPTRDEWPALDLAVAGARSWDNERVPMRLRAPIAPQITLPERVRPGAAVDCRVATGVAGTVVTAAVVDERIFAIAADRTPEPAAALRPAVAEPRWRHTASAAAMTGTELLGSMLVGGRVPASALGGSLDQGPGAAGGAAGAGAGAELRTDFRATAAFVTVVAGADGVAQLPFTLPDDLTTWRVSLVGVAPDGAAFFERRQLQTRLPFAAEPVLPRVLRVGDAVQVPIAVDRQARGDGVGETDAAQVSVACEGAALAVEDGQHDLVVAAGSAATALVTLRGLAAGDASLQLTASLGELQDGSRRPLQVHADALLRPVSAAAMGAGEVALAAPAGADAGDGLEISVLGGSGAAWAAIAQRLATYPYGCVEQTLSKLLPFFAAVRGAHVHGTPPPAADEPFQRRLLAGCSRLRQLQHGRGGAFSFWPGGEVDAGMTALVLHGLAVARDGGLDPVRLGLECDPQREPFAAAIAAVRARAGAAHEAAELLEVELAAGCLRLRPSADGARVAVAAAVDAEQALPAGLLARCGLALAAAGDPGRAQVCLQRSAALAEPGGAPSGYPGENVLAVRALQLELRCALAPRSADANACADVLLGCLNGYSTTYAQACALTALALALPPEESTPFTARLRVGVEDREVSLTPDNGFTARLRLPFAGHCAVTGPDGRQLVLRAVGQRREVGSTHAAWQAPVVVERALCRRLADATHEQVRRHEDLVPIETGALSVGEVVWLRLRVSAPQALRYVVVECPLPAGFEFGDDLPWLERFDDRFAVSFDWLGSEPRQIEVPLVPTLAGRMIWPPTTASPMYEHGRDGGTAGSVLTVQAVAPDPARPSHVRCFARLPVAPEPVTAPVATTPRQRAEDALDALDEAFDGEDPTALTAALAVVTEACGELRTPGGEPDFVLDELTDRIESWRDGVRLGDGSRALRAARSAVLLSLAEQQHGCTLQVLEAFESHHDREYDLYHVDTLVAALSIWPARLQREERIARVLELAMARGELPMDVLDGVEGPVEDEHLRAVLQAMLATFPEVHGARALGLLPRADLAAIPAPSLLELAGKPWPDGVVRQLLRSASGKVALRRALADPDFVLTQSEALAAELPEAQWLDLPLSVFAALFDYDLEGVDLAELLPRSNVSTAALQQELASAKNGRWQSFLALALHRRGVRDLGSETIVDDPYGDAWRRALALAPGDAVGALLLLDQIAAELAFPDDALLGFLREFVVRDGSIDHLARIAGDFDEDQCERLFARLDPAQTVALLGLVAEPLAALPIARTAAHAAALGAYAERLQQQGAAVAALCRSEVGLRFAEQQPTLLEVLRWHLGLDEDTGLPPADEPWLPLLRAVTQRGVPLTWTTAERQLYDRLRRLRGVR